MPGLPIGPAHLPRLTRIARLAVKYGRRDLFETGDLGSALDGELELDDADAATGRPEDLAADLVSLGPTFVKLGQLLATRSDLLPEPYLESLQDLQDDVDPLPVDEIVTVVEEELGVRLSRVFPSFDEEPLASASLAQVHRAELRDGREVAVKVQRPGIRAVIRDDLELLIQLAELADEHTEAGRRFNLTAVVEQFRASLVRELDFRRELSNLEVLRRNLREQERLLVPEGIDDLTTSRVLTMELVHGRKVTDIPDVLLVELDAEGLVDELFQAYLGQVLADGFVHADPHPGNVLLTDDRRLALIDAGMVLRVETGMREHLLRLLLAVAQGNGGEAASSAERLGERTSFFDEQRVRGSVASLVEQAAEVPAAQLDVGRLVMQVARACGEGGLRPAPELTLLGRTLLNLDQVGRTLAPDFDADAAIRRHVGEVITSHMLEQLRPSLVLRPLLESKDLLAQLPARANRILEDLSAGEFTVRVDAFDEDRLSRHIQKVANRVTAGLVLAALIVGAAMLMRVETQDTLFGYPALALIFFVVAFLGGFVLVVVVIFGDHRNPPRD